jgi:hypothetical protein
MTTGIIRGWPPSTVAIVFVGCPRIGAWSCGSRMNRYAGTASPSVAVAVIAGEPPPPVAEVVSGTIEPQPSGRDSVTFGLDVATTAPVIAATCVVMAPLIAVRVAARFAPADALHDTDCSMPSGDCTVNVPA